MDILKNDIAIENEVAKRYDETSKTAVMKMLLNFLSGYETMKYTMQKHFLTCLKSERTGGVKMNYNSNDYSDILGMAGFSDTLLGNHFTLYQGYVKNTNLLSEKLKSMLDGGNTSSPEYAELKRRFGFEFNGMRLHEYYFGNLGGDGIINRKSSVYNKIVESFGTYEKWEKDFASCGMMRGIGWVILYKDPITGILFNQWINEHETGHLAGCLPLLVMDVFEHAFLTDYGLKRADYVKAFMKNVNWDTIEERLSR